MHLAESITNARAVYLGWETYHERLIEAISSLTIDQLGFRTAPHLRSVGENCRHVIGAQARWCHYELGLGGDALLALGVWDDKGAPERPATELVGGLRTSWGALWDALGAWTLADLAQTVPNTSPSPGEPDTFTRQWVIWHLIEHELHHGGEISLILGSHGLMGLDI